MSKRISSSFTKELEAAGLSGLPFSWSSTGELFFSDGVTADQQAAIQAVYNAHDPDKSDFNDNILCQIAALEALETQRRVAEAVLGTEQQVIQVDGTKLGWLADNRNKIAALRAQLKK